MLNKKQIAFRARATALAKKIAPQYGVDWRLMVAAAILESGWGDSELAQHACNLFGIKATASTPDNDIWRINGERFRRYSSEENAFCSYGWLMRESSHYAEARDAALQMFVDVMAPVYCPPDPEYSTKIMRLIKEIDEAGKETT
ncbi:MAG: glucosaminidase domain-containing protein [Gammaproteobacteria bacterium]|nr:glucosaminidase domain-containing protein [Gammaproteobacteria bacterium]